MNIDKSTGHFDWHRKLSWKKSAINTAWCLLGCSIGDNLTILLFQWYAPHAAMWIVMITAVLMALVTSVSFETLILVKEMSLKEAIKVALGMSFISMIMMETAANLTSILFTGGNRLMLTWYSLVPSWLAGFLSAWPYNYYKITKYGKTCH